MTQNRPGLFGGGQTRSTTLSLQLLQYGVAVLSVALALGINLLFRTYLEPTPTPLFFAAVMVSAWYGGLGPGLLATVLSTIVVNYFYISPLYSLNINNVGYLMRLSVFVMAALLINSLNQAQRSAQRRAEANLQAWRDSEARFSRLAESGIIGTILADLNGSVIEANDAFLNMVGYTREDLCSGQVRWQEMTPAEYLDVSQRSQAELRTSGVCTPFEKEYIRKDGSRAPILLGSAMLTENTVIGFVLDITDRKQTELALRQSETTLNALIASSPVGIALFDRELRYVHANEALAEINGIPLSEHLGQRLEEVLPAWAPTVAPILQRVMDTNEPLLNQEISGVTSPSNLMRHALVNYFPVCLSDGQVLGVGVTSMDVTGRKQAEAVRLRLAEEREQLLAREKTARAEAETANRIKDEFLAVLSHELRSPLNPILGWSKLLQTRKLSEQKTQQALATIERNAKLQTQLIEDLLDVSRILRGKLVLNIAPVSLSSTIEAALETVKLAIETKGIRIQKSFGHETDLIMGDTARLQQVIWNLLTNAVKFTPPGGTVAIRLEQNHNCVQIQVRDTGIGITPDFLPYVFDYFRQEDGTTTRKFGGLGLGLAIVRHITELHGGTVWAESLGEGMGSTFTVQLPLLKGQDDEGPGREGEPPATPAPPYPLVGIHVLTIDDDGDVRELVEFVLQQAGAKVRVAASATEALQQLETFSPDVLISDVGMPDMDGYMLMRQIKALAPERQTIPAIALTAYAGEIDRQEAIAAGFQLHLAKPVEPETLINAIVTLLNKNSASDPNRPMP
ncbi:PAS domain S-box protein [Nodosilinea sp. LEGE 06152]|uniref:hybrid sensor histidine kinase/response regulator n=1 Tax=Nodosilinea sp. LEGE 06152 TaxID=2777966 RepID=UPI0018812C5A|nr:ATP-binding protein [Nodosilinea sp. LEGE 06152]MBE9157277.1 PAS domain S-box protein [Nodosilinea sp. LEGE 06152]